MTMKKPKAARQNEGLGVPPTEVELRPKRRRFTLEYKRRIIREADACTEPGQIGAMAPRTPAPAAQPRPRFLASSSSLLRWVPVRTAGAGGDGNTLHYCDVAARCTMAGLRTPAGVHVEFRMVLAPGTVGYVSALSQDAGCTQQCRVPSDIRKRKHRREVSSSRQMIVR